MTDPGIYGMESSDKKGVFFAVAILGLAVAAIAFQWLAATTKLDDLEEQISQLNSEKSRLGPIIVEVEEYQAKLAELKAKEGLIERLRTEREGPVRMLDALSTELPDFVWLEELSQQGNTVTIDGMAASYVSIADYIRKLEDSDWFQNVELIDAQVDRRQEQEFTVFELRTQLVAPQNPGSALGGPSAPGAGAR
jgi:Tfp pilus assembly protein PilN